MKHEASSSKSWAHQAGAELVQNMVQNVWYDILPTVRDARVYFIAFTQATTGETIELRITIDGQVLVDSAVCAAGALKHVYIGSYTEKCWIWDTAVNAFWYTFFEGKSIRIEIRKTTNNGAGIMTARTKYALLRP